MLAELIALLVVEGGEEVLLGGRDGALGAPQQLLSRPAQSQHVAPAVGLVAGPVDEAAVAERGGDRGEVAGVDADRVCELGLAGLAEHLELLEDEELLSAEAERAHRATYASGRVAAEPCQERRHRHLLGGGRGVAHLPSLGNLRLFTTVVDYH